LSGEIFFYIVAGVLVLYAIRRYVVVRSITEYSPGEVEEKNQSDRGTMLLDVRTAKEWNQNHIKGAHHIPLHELGRRYSELEKHKNKEIICYCQTGNRSLTAAIRLKRLGFTVAHMKGGLAEWNFRNLR
jgi:rhodanese-related sulfurtransferase